MIAKTLILGFLFGAVLHYARLNKFNTISGLALRKNFAVAKAIALAIGIGAIILNIEIALGGASYHVKPFVFGGIVLGGLIFGAGMAILGYCPGTMAVSLGEGAIDALIGIIGGLLGGIVYTLVLPAIQPVLGPNWGAISVNSLTGNSALFYILIIVLGAVFIGAAFMLHQADKNKDRRWIAAGIGLAVLNPIVFATVVSNRPIGASTTYPYLGDLLTGLTQNAYFEKISTPGNWELIFLVGAFLAGVVFSLVKKEFKLTLLYENWEQHKNNSKSSRMLWAFIGGFILIFGARMAGGCTSGHILSGGMQLAISSLVFAVFVFAGLLLTGKIFYK